MPKYKVVRNCYGFKGKYWEKDEIVVLASDIKPPHHFKMIGKEESFVKVDEEEEVTILSEINRKELIAEAENKGIKEADILNENELLSVLEPDASRQKISAVIREAKKRIK